jgi:hypothetical protein
MPAWAVVDRAACAGASSRRRRATASRRRLPLARWCLEVVSRSFLLSAVDICGGSPHASIRETRARLEGVLIPARGTSTPPCSPVHHTPKVLRPWCLRYSTEYTELRYTLTTRESSSLVPRAVAPGTFLSLTSSPCIFTLEQERMNERVNRDVIDRGSRGRWRPWERVGRHIPADQARTVARAIRARIRQGRAYREE